MITIDKGVKSDNLGSTLRKYPLHLMDVGDSFCIEIEKSSSVRQSMHHYQIRSGKKFTTRKVGDKLRVWRTA